MSIKLRWRVVCVLAVVIGSAILTWFPKPLTLGLDLRGGVQFVLRANVDEALRVDPNVSRDDIVEQARQAVDRRVNELGVVEPLILVQGGQRDEILVQLPGFTDVDRARAVLGTTARLEWKLVETRDATPFATEILSGRSDGATYRVRRDADVTGRDVRSAQVTIDDDGLPAVSFTLTPDGGRRFGALTSGNTGRQLAIVLDGKVHSAPVIEQAITGGSGTIRGGFTHREASNLAIVLRSGALPVSLTFLGGQYVGPTLGQQSIRSGVLASLMGLALVAAFMLLYYRRAGVNAVLSIVVNLVVLLGAMAVAGAAMTLPGIAGLILTIGMGVDSNVLIFERIREELTAGRPIRNAVRAGFDRVFLTILDTHVASLIAAAFLFQFGSGPIRGFATTLTIGLLVNVFTAVFVSRTLFEVSLSRARERATLWSAVRMNALTRAFDFMKWRLAALVLSTIVVGGGATTLVTRGGLPVGLDFTGGTSVVAKFEAPVSEDVVRAVIAGDESVQRFGPAEDHALLIRTPRGNGDPSADPGAGVSAIRAALTNAALPGFEITGSSMVGPALGADFQRKAMMAAAASLAGISAYIALRFRPSFAAGAMVATVHDLAVTTSMLGLFGFDLTLNTVAAVLTIAGYSVNDTIVIFDRVRENLRSGRPASIADAINLAVNQTLGRTFITAGTTFLSVLALYLFGGDVLHGFAFAMLVGIATGTYSTIFVAAPIAALLARKNRRA